MNNTSQIVTVGLVALVAGIIVFFGVSELNEMTSQEREDAALSLISRYPMDPEGLERGIEQSDYANNILDKAIGRLIRKGLVEATPEGLRVRTESINAD